MRKFAVFTVLVMFLLPSCRKEKFDMDLLYGSWIEEANAGHPRPMIDFNSGGDYCLTDYINLLPGSTAVYRCIITGEFEINGTYVTLVTAEVQSMDEEPDPGGFPYEGIDIEDGASFGSFFGCQESIVFGSGAEGLSGVDTEYTPVTWEVLGLSENILEVKVALDTVRYVRQ